MGEIKEGLQLSEDGISFVSVQAAQMREIYMPLCSPDATGIKSAITPFLSGDIKIDRSRYLTKPVSRQDLRMPVRNFFVRLNNGEIFSLLDREDDVSAHVQGGQLWHKLINRSARLGLVLEVTNFVPVSGEKVELMKVLVRNESAQEMTFKAVGCVPIFGRPLVNKHDHEHVTSLLHRVKQLPQGVFVSPTMVFNEEGHKEAKGSYFVFGAEENGGLAEGSFPTVESFLGDGGTWECPEAVSNGVKPVVLTPEQINGKEVAGALAFREETLKPGEGKTYIVMIGAAQTEEEAVEVYGRFQTLEKVNHALDRCQSFWMGKSGSITFETADENFNFWMRWVMLQPILRRIFGCSFLPDHDYGKGGKGWRDLWQDLLSLILIEPEHVRLSLIENFGGVRVDGTNATIIGSHPGEFIADRNAITRAWMDHGAWPVLTVMLYIDQTGDMDVLFEQMSYFRDTQLSRTIRKDFDWRPADGNVLLTKTQEKYVGTVLEHMLVQTLTQFFNVGEHNMLRLESADWNDGLDMAFERGESTAFSSFYAANLNRLADVLDFLQREKGIKTVEVFQELTLLLDNINSVCCNYDDIQQKRRLLFEEYFPAVEPQISGKKVGVDCDLLIQDLRRKADWIFKKIALQEKVSIEHAGKHYQWFNGYYDNDGEIVEGKRNGIIRMTLTGQVFAVMSGLADEQETRNVIASVDAFLKDSWGGVRLNTDFGLRNYFGLGRAFSFAYGTKENGAVFSHMAVMYAYALYIRGFAREGFDVIHALYRKSADFLQSKIYPNLPEYFDREGRGMYGYLTGSASWMILTLLTQVFGMRGERGNLVLEPKLVCEQFSQEGQASVKSVFAGKNVTVRYQNLSRLDYGAYIIREVKVNGREVDFERFDNGAVRLCRSVIEKINGSLDIDVTLGEKFS
jgi:cellobiose phosphorylase